MTNPNITAIEALSRDYSETPWRVLFVLGSGTSPAVEVFEAAAQQRTPNIDPQHLAEMAAGRRRSLAHSNLGGCTSGCGGCRQHSRSDRRGNPLDRFWVQCGPLASAPARR
jgi:hypothetical protein